MNMVVEIIENIFPLLGTWVTVVGGIGILFERMEKTASLEGKKKVSDWLKSLTTKSVSKTLVESPLWFIEAFDKIFGDKHLTWHCFLRSCIASIFSVTIMTIILFFLNPTIFGVYIEQIYWVYIFVFIFNILPDYISLLETRWILHNIRNAGIQKLSVLLIFDVIITTVIFFGVTLITVPPFIVFISSEPSFSYQKFLYEIFINIITGSSFASVYFYSTFFTSIWLYLFIISSITVKFLIPSGRFGIWVMSFFDINEKPFLTMGITIILFVTLAFASTVIFSIAHGLV